MTLAQAADVEESPTSTAISTRGRRYRTLVDLVIVAGAALALRLPAVGFGLPGMVHPDEPGNISVGATMAANKSWDPHAFSYPSLMYDVIAVVDRGAKLITGHMIVPSSFTGQTEGNYRTSDPNIVLSMRLVTVALSVGICLVVYGVLRRLTGRRLVAVGCGLLAATSPLLITNGVFITPDTYSAFFTVATLAASLAVLRRGRLTDYLLAGAAVGFTAGSKYDIVVAVPVVIAYLLREGRNAWRPRTMVPLVWAALVAAAVFTLTTPALLFDTHSMFAGLNYELNHYATGHPGAEGDAIGFYVSSIVHDEAVLVPGAVLALIAAWRGRFRRETIVVVTFSIAYFALISSQYVRFDRDVLPLLPALMLLTGFGVVWLVEVVAARRPALPRAGGLAVAGTAFVAAVVPILVSAVAVPGYLQEKPRSETVAWLEAHVPRGSSVVNEAYGPWLNLAMYHVTNVPFAVEEKLPADAQAIILTDKGSGRFLGDDVDYPTQNAGYQAMLAHYCVAVKFTDGPWIEILTPCGS